ncbi:hypothetical protein [Microbacterium sp. Marseille-Q6965]|uniref:hypothetical protein n=1 Tax=Microbacterium sp. Marseille-Q6965 TaxID=2965072 RepID=UPI0021B84583|nr:hypothetical protein [Microbacterium sp. Marseille-Q6965]
MSEPLRRRDAGERPRDVLERAATDPVELIESLAHDAPSARTPARRARPHRPRRPLAGVSLTASVIGLVLSWFVPWGMPVSVAGALLAILALRRSDERRGQAWWGLGLGILGAACASFWIGWILDQLSATTAG